MRQDVASVHPSGGRRSFNSFYRSFPARSLGGLARENLFRSSHSLSGGGGHFLCANYFPFGITSRPLPPFQSLPTRTTDGHSAPLELFLPSVVPFDARRSIGHLPRGNTCTCRPRPIAHPERRGGIPPRRKR